jgi:hypothetical protein
MKQNRATTLLAIILATGIVTIFSCSRPTSTAVGQAAPQSQIWEYKVVKVTDNAAALEQQFNTLGADGWEHSGGFEAWAGVSVFKRPKH